MIDPDEAEMRFPIDRPFSLGDLRLRKCGENWMFYRKHDFWIGRSLERFGEYSGDEVKLLVGILSEGDVVVEAGANIGCITIPMARAAGALGEVYAFEPQRDAFIILCASLAVNGIDNVKPLQSALGDELGTGSIQRFNKNERQNFGDATVRHDGIGDPVEIMTVDSLALQRCNLIKIDVQGMERDVLLGAEETIERCRPIIYVENGSASTSRSLLATILALGYVAHWHYPLICSSPELASGTDFEDVASINVLCLPVESKLRVADVDRVKDEMDWPSQFDDFRMFD